VEAYSYRLQQYTTTKITAEEIHQTSLRMVAEIEEQMDGLLRQLGRTEGPVRARMEKLRDDQPTFPVIPEGRAEYEAAIERTIGDAAKRAALLFERVPKAAVVARPYPEFMGPKAPSYSPPAPDGPRPGTFQFPVFGVPLTRFGLRTTAYHEAIPGHHFQIALQMEDTTLPRFRKHGVFGSNSAYAEGWGSMQSERRSIPVGTKGTRSACSASSMRPYSGRGAWWWIPGYMPSTGRCSRPSIIWAQIQQAARWRKSSVTW
jgi:uncharacterized protein (DUF885 family)